MGFNIVETLLGLTLLGAEWVLWLLIVLSVTSIAVIFERGLFFWRIGGNFLLFKSELSGLLNQRDWAAARKLCETEPTFAAQVAAHGLSKVDAGITALEASVESQLLSEKQRMERGMTFLGTLGNNAPFIGLFGTVIGIIKAFHDLAMNPAGGPTVVMGGISEALVATAVGLIVAIPAVIAFNTFSRQIKKHMVNAQSVVNLLKASLSSRG